MDATILKAFFMLTACVGGIGLLFFFLKKYSGKIRKFSSSTEIKVTGKASLMPKSHIFVVNVGGKELLLGVTDNNITTLAELNDTPVGTNNYADSFEEMLTKESGNPAKHVFKHKEETPSPKSKIDLAAARIKQDSSVEEDLSAAEDLSFKSFLKSIAKVG